MQDRNCELLFEYLRSILYDNKINPLDIDELDEPFRKLGQGMQVLQRCVEELKIYTADLSSGNLSGEYPSKDNLLCTNLKNLHANLNHLTWQAKQVADGDYSQKVFYMGEFSDAFNTMTALLSERENKLRADIREITLHSDKLVTKAYHDPGTGLFNRQFFDEHMDKLLRSRSDFTLCYLDIDGLKSVNDQFGHTEGDAYICRFVCVVQRYFRNTDVFARVGGDEFCIILSGHLKQLALSKFKQALHEFSRSSRLYSASFSYGIVEVDGQTSELTPDEIIRLADKAMYRCKRQNKRTGNGSEDA